MNTYYSDLNILTIGFTGKFNDLVDEPLMMTI